MSREPLKRSSIVAELRQRITAGELAAGQRLPIRSALQDQFTASSITIQHALDELVANGFVEARGRQGTFVAEYPPHLHHYGLMIPEHPVQGRYSAQFWNALVAELTRLQQQSPLRFTVYDGMDEHADSQHYQILLDAIAAGRLAGLIVPAPHRLPRSIDLSRLPLPVAITAMGDYKQSNFHLDISLFFTRALEHLATKGVRTVAIIMSHDQDERIPELKRDLAERAMICHPHWLLACDLGRRAWARNIAHAIMHPGQDEYPQALIISDDNLVEQVSLGLAEIDLGVQRRIEVIAHCNFPSPTPSRVPVTRLGFDVRAFMARCLAAIDRRRRGGDIGEMERISPVFEHELSRGQRP